MSQLLPIIILCLLALALVVAVITLLRSSGRARAAESLESDLRQRVGQHEARIQELQEALEQARTHKTQAETSLSAAEKSLAEQRGQLKESVALLENSFKALSDDALKSNNQAFIELAKGSLETVLATGKGELGKKEQAIEALVKPLTESLKKYEGHIQQLEESRQRSYGSLDEHLRNLGETQKKLQQETHNLVFALRKPQVRGRWGEITLRRVVELAGLSEHCDFSEQVSKTTEEGRLRPDLLVSLPTGRQIVIDAKVALEGYLLAFDETDEAKREKYFLDHARQMRDHMKKLAEKSYWRQFENAPEFVVMFIPGEPFLAKAAEYDRTLLEDGFANQVILSTPSTLIALLKAVAYGWRQEELTKNARKISELGKELYDRLRSMARHLSNIGDGLKKANDSYNKAISSLETRVLVSGRKFRDLGAGEGDEIPAATPLDIAPREISAAELNSERDG